MYMSPELLCYLQQLNGCLHSQNQQIKEMNGFIQQLVKEVNQLKEKSAQPTVIRNEYKFDLLKVETLSGTLNIGIKPDGKDSSIEEFAVEQSMNVETVEKEYPELYKRIQEQITGYLHHDAYATLRICENKYDYTLDDPYRKFIVEDVKKQIDGRIRYYLNQFKAEQVEPEQLTQMEWQIVENIKRDIEQTFETFVKHLPSKGNQ
ncbi:MAG TPA: spore germination protein GerPC [Paenibacillus sp.]|uniref:spore germination protein GerPC n=1 Tax=Paenibacillus sp. TaxID=58172 RepID=UPI002BE2E8E1|nr:spore germination protein GerPC [Paenibacillus sp.]HUC92228.1 spore germination protein GerPC [Paenibacillus sp.]